MRKNELYIGPRTTCVDRNFWQACMSYIPLDLHEMYVAQMIGRFYPEGLPEIYARLLRAGAVPNFKLLINLG